MTRPFAIAIGTIAIVAAAVVVYRAGARPPAFASSVTADAGAVSIPDSATVKDVMAAVIDPAADALWLAVGSEITASATVERAPTSDAEWNALVAQSRTLAAGARALLDPRRARDQTDWRRYALALEAASRVAGKAAAARDKDGLFASGEGIVNACDSCHEKYWTTPAVPGE